MALAFPLAPLACCSPGALATGVLGAVWLTFLRSALTCASLSSGGCSGAFLVFACQVRVVVSSAWGLVALPYLNYIISYYWGIVKCFRDEFTLKFSGISGTKQRKMQKSPRPVRGLLSIQAWMGQAGRIHPLQYQRLCVRVRERRYYLATALAVRRDHSIPTAERVKAPVDARAL